MISELGKNILFLIINSTDYAISSVLSKTCNVSISTIRKEIDLINEYLEDKGCHIESKTSSGYNLVYDNSELAKHFIKAFLRDYRRFKYMNTSNFSNAYFIIRKLLTSSRLLSVEDLADELYVSKSTVLRSLNNVRDYLTLLSLQLKTIRNKGLSIEGKEWNKRLCLIYMHKIYIHSTNSSNLKEYSFESQFMEHFDVVKPINRAIASSLANFPSIKMTGLDMAKIRNMIILNYTRKKYTPEIFYTDKQYSRIQNSDELLLAQAIYQYLPEQFIDEYVNRNTEILAGFLIGCRSYTSFSQLSETDCTKYKKETEKIIQLFSAYYDVSYLFDTQFIEDFSCYLAKLENVHLFELITDKEVIASSTSTGMFTNDLCTLFAMYYYNQKQILLEESDLVQAYFIINRALVQNRSQYTKKRILIASRYGIHNAKRVALSIQNKFSSHIVSIETCEYSDLFNADLSNYDILATDEDNISYLNNYRNTPINTKFLSFSIFRSSQDFEQLAQYFEDSSRHNALQIFKESNLHKLEIHSHNDIYDFLYSLYGSEVGDINHFTQDLKMKAHFINPERDKGIIFLSPLAYKLENPAFEVIIPTNSFIWDQNKVNAVIFYQQGDGSIENRTLISYLCSQFIHQSEVYLSQLIDMDYSQITQEFKPNKFR